jgi:FdrA protein
LPVHALVKPNVYFDSVTLMLVARELGKLPGIQDAAVLMGTDANKSILEQSGLLTGEAGKATPNDLILAVRAAGDARAALAQAEALLYRKPAAEGGGEARPRSLRAALQSQPDANLAIISVAGRYAAAEAWSALRSGLHVLLFSDNVALEDEIALKRYAVEHALLLMGPGAGTAILNGIGLGFANVVPSGPVGIVSAAGTGLQEVSSLLARAGSGITQAIGTGGRDLKKEVGGLMMLAGLQALQTDAATRVITLVSKPPDHAVAARILKQVEGGSKPTVICLLGERENKSGKKQVHQVATLEEAAAQAARLAGVSETRISAAILSDEKELRMKAEAIRSRLGREQKYLRGLFSGGTLCYEAQCLWARLLGEPVLSNAPVETAKKIKDATRSRGHTAIDLGEEEFTVGKPHPMIDNELRIRRLLQEAHDPQVAVIMLDVVLGYGAHPDPAAELAPAIRQAQELAGGEGHPLACVASVTGTPGDPQGLEATMAALRGAGAEICKSNAAAARLAAWIVV